MIEFTKTLWLTLGFAGMALGTVPPLWQLLVDAERRTHYLVLAGITGVAAVAYAGMALEIGTLSVDGRPLYTLRYADWFLTTLLLVGYLWLLTGAGRRALVRVLALDAAVILLGVGAVVLPDPLRFVVFTAGGVAFLALARDLVVTLPARATATDARRVATFEKLRNLTVVLWTLYPVVWLLGPAGLGLLVPATEVLVFVYLDVVAKAGFVVIAVNWLAGTTGSAEGVDAGSEEEQESVVVSAD
ncbi:bacteriorhodopsin [Halobaculum gomorrense]|uniref:Sensory rhodopsin n=1 Tax=Halobaculum gomorrense TaxID=43928 RepID=A0A1M5MCT4_9EURY|nr:bacteriorhodopsin [Halobaculum gomorrense]SHG75035.1 sensory rhodopsin [Halobaculum gomorrense]